jgi:UDP-N-acetylmuramoylalanine--D-glutamate ligase
VDTTAIEHVRGMRISVIGAARSGVAVARFLASQGAQVFVSDQQPEQNLQTQTAELARAGIPYETGSHSDRVYDADLLVLSPGVPSDAPVVREAVRRLRRVVSEIEVASWFCPARIIAVTGSNGKTTTTALLGRILADAKRLHLVGGNIGTAFSSLLPDLTDAHLAVLEISSFQLDHIERFRPWISLLLNITEDHMDRYDHSMEKYAASKARIFMNQRDGDVLIYNADDPWTARVAQSCGCRSIPVSAQQRLNEGAYLDGTLLVTRLGGVRTDVIDADQISIRGIHNLYNSMAAVLAAQVAGVKTASLRATLRNFKGVEHRLEFVRDLDGVQYINDSKATNVDSVYYALLAYRRPIVLLLGGRDKGNDYSRLLGIVRERVKAIIALGESAAKVRNAFEHTVPVTEVSSLNDAVQTARRLAAAGDIVLLSPACASFDWFENFEHRGRVFKELVHQL